MSIYLTRLQINLASLSAPLRKQFDAGAFTCDVYVFSNYTGTVVEKTYLDRKFDLKTGKSIERYPTESRYTSWEGGAKTELSAAWVIKVDGAAIWANPVKQLFLDGSTGTSTANILRTTSANAQLSNGQPNQKIVTLPSFYHFSYQDIEQGIAQRTNNPYLIDQGSSSLCGVAVAAYFYARKRPADYAQFVRSLHKYGKATAAAGYVLTTDSDKHLQEYAVISKKYPNATGSGKVHPVDFMLLASLRDHLNGVFDYDPDNDNAGGAVEGGTGMTLPPSVTLLMKKMIGLRDVSFVLPIQKPSLAQDSFIIKSVDEIKRYLAKEYCIAMLIRMAMLKNRTSISPIPEHWIGIHEIEYNLTSRTIDMTVFTWGGGDEKTYEVIPFTVFSTNFFGFAKGVV